MFPKNTDHWDAVWRKIVNRGYLLPDEAPDTDTIDELVEKGWLRRDDHGYIWPEGAMQLHIEMMTDEKEE
ncbi:hypothetical protein [Halorubrum lacusprofundi]|jgi:hypothetical protein|uniref:hypothetical protein n=1 Tax=Halorubrum lacusprofundi TaxID=2247 RepID=UPI000B5A8001|nr:hypothetical protein [Halorubrum lacusprofundi]MCG1007938.1 hypothetical protein [Halorubrum lacusprofundi]